jgi:TM2 domain-containing membrane protein YozV
MYGGPQHPYYGSPQYGSPQVPPTPPAPNAYAMVPYGYVNPYAPYGVHPMTGVPYSDKSKVAAGILQIFLGKFGVGRFYTGHTGIAVAQLVTCMLGIFVLSWVTCGVSIAVVLWPIIDGILILTTDSTDAQGRPLRS